jgi:cyclopropane fatty-acyl-phospholipid synthase-like methyltransferase
MIREAERLHPELSGKIIRAVLPGEWPVFNKPFEAMFSIATLMHFSIEELDILLSRCREDLVPGALVLISVSGKREEKNESRDFLEMPVQEWLEIFRKNGYNHFSTAENMDASGRNISWYTFLLNTVGP